MRDAAREKIVSPEMLNDCSQQPQTLPVSHRPRLKSPSSGGLQQTNMQRKLPAGRGCAFTLATLLIATVICFTLRVSWAPSVPSPPPPPSPPSPPASPPSPPPPPLACAARLSIVTRAEFEAAFPMWTFCFRTDYGVRHACIPAPSADRTGPPRRRAVRRGGARRAVPDRRPRPGGHRRASRAGEPVPHAAPPAAVPRRQPGAARPHVRQPRVVRPVLDQVLRPTPAAVRAAVGRDGRPRGAQTT